MALVFILMGKKNSYCEYIKKYCSHHPSIHCGGSTDIERNAVNVICGGMKAYDNLMMNNNVMPVYIDTPDDQIIQTGLDLVKRNAWTCEEMCKRFIEDSSVYTLQVLEKINAKIIDADNECDACFEFMKYLKEKAIGYKV